MKKLRKELKCKFKQVQGLHCIFFSLETKKYIKFVVYGVKCTFPKNYYVASIC